MARTYYRITTTREPAMAGAGLGYEEMYGDLPRYYRDRESAVAALPCFERHCSDDLAGTYSVEERQFYSDGRFDDEYDPCAREQLGIKDPRS